MVLWSDFLVAGRKRRSGVWHHRCPDFKLVYCGSNGRVPKKEAKHRGRRVKFNVNADEDAAAGRRLEDHQMLG